MVLLYIPFIVHVCQKILKIDSSVFTFSICGSLNRAFSELLRLFAEHKPLLQFSMALYLVDILKFKSLQLHKKQSSMTLRVTPTKWCWPLSKCSLAKRRLGPVLEDSKPRHKHSVHRDKSRNKHLGPWHCVDYTSCKPHENQSL